MLDEKSPNLGASKLFGECGKVNFEMMAQRLTRGREGFSGLTLMWAFWYL